MVYYNNVGDLVEFEVGKEFNNGMCANVYHFGYDIVFKKYFSFTTKDCRIEYEIFELLKSLNNPHLLSLLETFYEENEVEDIDDFLRYINLRTVDAYTYRYVKEDPISILNERKDFLLTNMEEIEKLFKTLTEERVFLRDIKVQNSIINKSGIVIIDPDCFTFYDDKMEINLEYFNKLCLLHLFEIILKKELVDFGYSRKGLSDLFGVKMANNEDITSEVAKKLRMCKTPANYFSKL